MAVKRGEKGDQRNTPGDRAKGEKEGPHFGFSHGHEGKKRKRACCYQGKEKKKRSQFIGIHKEINGKKNNPSSQVPWTTKKQKSKHEKKTTQ